MIRMKFLLSDYQFRSAFKLMIVTLILILDLCVAGAQTSPESGNGARIKLSSVVIPLYDEGNNLKARFSGENTELIAGTSQTKVSEFKLELIKPGSASEVELEINADEGFYDSKTAYSPGDIEMKSGDGQFLVRGRGFSWDIQKGALIITNHIETILRPSSNEIEKQEDQPGQTKGFVGDWKEIKVLNIRSESLVYSIPDAVAEYKDSVKAFDREKLNVDAGTLKLQLRPEGNELDQLIVEKDVKVTLIQEKREYQISSGKAVYRRFGDGNEVLVFSENSPSWKTEDGSGKGEELSFFLPQKRVEVDNNAMAKVSIPETTRKIFLNKFGGTPIFGDHIYVECDAYVFENNRLSLSGIKKLTSDKTTIETGGVMVFLDDGFNARSLVAGPRFILNGFTNDTPFRIAGNDLVLTGLSSEDPNAEVQGNAEWIYGDHSGGGENLNIDLADLTIHCRGLAFIKLEVEEWVDNPEYRFPVDIKCAQYTFENQSITLDGRVTMSHPKWHLEAGTVDLSLEENSNQIKSIHAKTNVSMEAQFQIKKEKEASRQLTRFLGGLVEEGVPWKIYCQSIQLEIDNEEAVVSGFTALNNVRLIRAGNTGQGQKLEMLPESQRVELTIDPIFVMASGTTLKGERDTVFSWDMQNNSVKVSRGHYSVILPQKVFTKEISAVND